MFFSGLLKRKDSKASCPLSFSSWPSISFCPSSMLTFWMENPSVYNSESKCKEGITVLNSEPMLYWRHFWVICGFSLFPFQTLSPFSPILPFYLHDLVVQVCPDCHYSPERYISSYSPWNFSFQTRFNSNLCCFFQKLNGESLPFFSFWCSVEFSGKCTTMFLVHEQDYQDQISNS